MRCECGIMRDRAKSDPAFCSHEGFDHHEEYCCNCLLKTFHWTDYEEECCKQCQVRAAEAKQQES